MIGAQSPVETTPTQFVILAFQLVSILCFGAEARCRHGCELALASYYVSEASNLTYISHLFDRPVPEVQRYNPSVSSGDAVAVGTRVNVPLTCDCLNGDFLGHTFTYVFQSEDTYYELAIFKYSNLTTVEWMVQVNGYDPNKIADGAKINVAVNCTCGDRRVSITYGAFITYPLRPGDSLAGLAAESGLPARLLELYNPGADFSGGTGLVFVPAKGISSQAIAGISIAGVAVIALAAFFLSTGFYQKKKVMEALTLLKASDESYFKHGQGNISGSEEKTSELELVAGASRMLSGIMVDRSVEFSYEELAQATNGFSATNVIGRGGFGSVYYAKLRGEKTAIKKMDMHASREFLAELKVLTRVHHLNLVRLIGYCIEGSLFLVYEFLENGSLCQHLRGSDNKPLPWSARMNIALDSARGLEYIHESIVPVYIHRDVKSTNILIDRDFWGKVADFGLSKLTEYGSASLHIHLVGTFGYMSPEYAQYGDVSPKVDVYAFGVVLYELISAKQAVIKMNGFASEAKGLVALFEDVLNQPNPKDSLCKLVDPRLDDDYPLDLVYKMATLAKACTQDNPQLRPAMRSVVVALTALSSTEDDWDIGSFCEAHSSVSLVSGR
ncbi:hypothetical protein BT93_E2623 [Corymbia citriodora subsp. variegata]|nr:hypothetical protein BT93_E2623 [Corymbia citriodora subsp. variegata]